MTISEVMPNALSCRLRTALSSLTEEAKFSRDRTTTAMLPKVFSMTLVFNRSAWVLGFDGDFYKRNGLTAGVYFDRETFGVDRTLAYPLVNSLHYEGWIPVVESSLSHEEAVQQMPISDACQTRDAAIADHTQECNP